ncbi:MAG: SDR family oxidoreductase [Salinivirgaceae bacterium]|nr:SDR family oxidoreductase [Salinivirgaceae bacterium]
MEQYALITGASGGIGKELAHIHAQNRHNLILVARSEEKLEELKNSWEAQYKIKIMTFACDLSKPANATLIYDTIKKNKISIDFLINNAGFGNYGSFAKINPSIDISMIALNVQALTHIIHLFLPDMIAHGKGRIMNVSSIAGFFPGPFMATYYASKSYVLSLSEALANELQGTGVTVTALCPGPTQSNFANVANFSASKIFKSNIPTALDVAKFGFRAMIKGKTVAIHGTKNRLMVWASRFVTRKMLTNIIRKTQEIKP